MATEAELVDLDREWWMNKAQKALNDTGVLDPARVDRIRRFAGLSTGETHANLADALEGTYEGSAEGGRALLSAPGLARQRADRKGIGLAEAQMELAGSDTPEGSERIADLATARAERTGESYEVALVEVQRGGSGPGSADGLEPAELAEAEDASELAAGMGRTNYKPEAWVRSTVLHLESAYADSPDPTKHALPIRKPDGTLSLDAMKEAGRKLVVMDGVPPEKRREAARELLRAYRRVDENPPDSLAALAGETPRHFAEGASEGERGDVRIADLAEAYAKEHQVDYFSALVAVQTTETEGDRA